MFTVKSKSVYREVLSCLQGSLHIITGHSTHGVLRGLQISLRVFTGSMHIFTGDSAGFPAKSDAVHREVCRCLQWIL